ncbi:helix-turn-helix transcriptional regulator [Bradyrhizobium sp. UFLA06-06]
MKARALVAWNVRRIRVGRGVPQEQLAYDAGIDRSYMSGLERQKANPTIDLLDRIAKTLDVHVSELFVQPPKGTTSPKTLPKGRKVTRPGRRRK